MRLGATRSMVPHLAVKNVKLGPKAARQLRTANLHKQTLRVTWAHRDLTFPVVNVRRRKKPGANLDISYDLTISVTQWT